ncbi:AAA family ATPase [Altererythrobacter lutimaris]|uniref:AAA family ATPase n=1 Tax=Altererythrobacter lutimaris TaxID=2743979 RepID=A0A850HB80_9SPHN|nr:AAA family ATPase [Altererythrobacter lutimaris]NVE94166.1 AAA family ATPase [Altererythrobacter lutimaris]
MAIDKPKLNIKARYLGPIMELNGELTSHRQNLVFARNGAGKSFLTRAIRCLDRHGQGHDLKSYPSLIVSEESTDGRGSMSITQGDDFAASLKLDTTKSVAAAETGGQIFHVFSEDFVSEELREKRFNPDGDIQTEIAVDSENIEITEAEKALADSLDEKGKLQNELERSLTRSKQQKLIEKGRVSKNLREYQDLSFSKLNLKSKPDPPKQSYSEILSDLDALRGIPAEPAYPDELSWDGHAKLDIEKIKELLAEVTSPSRIADEVKKRIDSEPEFFRKGVSILNDSDEKETCPFCEQEFRSEDTKRIIDGFVSYFADREERHKQTLRAAKSEIERTEQSLGRLLTSAETQIARFDTLKSQLPSKKSEELLQVAALIQTSRASLQSIADTLAAKISDVSKAIKIDLSGMEQSLSNLSGTLSQNNTKVRLLNSAIRSSDTERRELHRKLCRSFRTEFLVDSWIQIEALRQADNAIKANVVRLEALQRNAPSTNARTRVAETFEMLLRFFFAGKYAFDREKFVITMGDKRMTRGADRTLSDGEKTAIAFCYFIASIHKKVASNADYAKIFVVFDDPVTSMSYDYIFSIVQSLKNLNISDAGAISINPSTIDGSKSPRPRILIFTHSSYFFNVAYTNRAVKPDGAFSLSSGGEMHTLARLDRYVAPFEEQLRHVKNVAEGAPPDHSTANCVRSVLEAIGRFCRPDKAASLTDFVKHLAGEDSIEIRSVLVNSLSHGSYAEEVVSPDDLKAACEEALSVVRLYAVGQLEALDR